MRSPRPIFCALLVAALLGGAAGCGDGGTAAVDAADAADSADTALPDTEAPDTGADTAEPADTTPEDTGDTSVDELPDTAEDTAAAPFCGDGTRDPDEACDDGAGNSDTAPNACRIDCEAASCGDGVTDDGESCDDGNPGNLDGCTTSCTFGAIVAAPSAPGDVVINELMVNPDAVNDVHGEWVELVNTTATALNLDGCELRDDGTDRAAITAPTAGLVIGPGLRVALGPDAVRTQNGGVTVDFAYTNMLLDNVADEVELVCGGVVIDRVAYDAAHWPLISGRALSLDPTRRSAADNDRADSWCPAVTAYGEGDQGTPGAPNTACLELDTTVDGCILTAPGALAGFTEAPIPVSVEVREVGVTDLTLGVDASPNLRVEVGSGPTGSAPTAGGWAFQPAGPAPGWVGGPDARDGYVGGIVFATPGVRDVAARASRDRGATWVYCDRGAGASDGYDPALASVATVAPTPCAADSCEAPPESLCDPDGVTVHGFDPAGRCTPVDATHVSCAYDAVSVDCTGGDSVCEDGACGGVAATPAFPGEVVFTEVMLDPTQVSRRTGQWLELAVPGGEPLDLDGCELGLTTYGAGLTPREASFTVGEPLIMPAGGIRVVGAAAEDNGGITVAAAWGDAFTLPTGVFVLTLRCGGVGIDELAYTPETFPHVLGKAVSLSPYQQTAAGNDAAGAWCAASTPYGTGDRGTPGMANPACPGDIVTPTQCRLVELPASTAGAGTALDVRVRLVASSVTAVSSRTDPNDAVTALIGIGPAGVPRTDPGWVWTAAAPDLQWLATSASGLGLAEDRYLFATAAPPPGAWAILARVTVDGGHSEVLCDAQGIVAAGGTPSPLALTTSPSACSPSPCTDAPGLGCEAAPGSAAGAPMTLVRDFQAPSRCALGPDLAPMCLWHAEPVADCAPLGGVCEDGACARLPVTPGPGDVVVSELMIVPPSSELGEWLELTNVRDEPMSLAGCRLESGPAEVWSVPEVAVPKDAVIAVGAAIVIARSPFASINGAVQPRFNQTAVGLGNTGDWLQLVCGDVVVDTVAWELDDGWVIPTAKALSLSGNRLDAQANDFAEAWCPATPATPRAANAVCPGVPDLF